MRSGDGRGRARRRRRARRSRSAGALAFALALGAAGTATAGDEECSADGDALCVVEYKVEKVAVRDESGSFLRRVARQELPALPALVSGMTERRNAVRIGAEPGEEGGVFLDRFDVELRPRVGSPAKICDKLREQRRRARRGGVGTRSPSSTVAASMGLGGCEPGGGDE